MDDEMRAQSQLEYNCLLAIRNFRSYYFDFTQAMQTFRTQLEELDNERKQPTLKVG